VSPHSSSEVAVRSCRFIMRDLSDCHFAPPSAESAPFPAATLLVR
jgi:hypothetical protein